MGYPIPEAFNRQTIEAVKADVHDDALDICDGNCPDGKRPTAQHPKTGRYYIAMGHPGFNSPANNGNGYATERAALAALRRYSRPRALSVADDISLMTRTLAERLGGRPRVEPVGKTCPECGGVATRVQGAIIENGHARAAEFDACNACEWCGECEKEGGR